MQIVCWQPPNSFIFETIKSMPAELCRESFPTEFERVFKLLFWQGHAHVYVPYMDTRRQQENGNANAQQLPVFDVLGYFLLARSCIEHFATFGRIQQVNSRSLPRSLVARWWTSDGQPNEPKCRPLKAPQRLKRFLFSFWFDLAWFRKTYNFAHEGSIEMSTKNNAAATKLATCWGQLGWPSYETPFGSGECTPAQCGKVWWWLRLLAVHMKVSFVGNMHFPTCQQIAAMAKGNCLQHATSTANVWCKCLMMWIRILT